MSCDAAFCCVHKRPERIRACDECRRAFCSRHLVKCEGGAWRAKRGLIEATFDDDSGEDRRFGAVWECSYTCCTGCLPAHRCGDPIADRVDRSLLEDY